MIPKAKRYVYLSEHNEQSYDRLQAARPRNEHDWKVNAMF